MATGHDTLVVVPTYNELENLPVIAPRILEAAPVDLLVVDDNSPDGTGDLADRMAAQIPSVRVMHRTAKEGLGRAYVDAFQHALGLDDGRYQRICQMDADLSHDPRYLPGLLEATRDGGPADLCIGSRYVAGGGVSGWPVHRHILSRGGSLYARTVLGLPVRDLTGGFKCWRREVLEAIDLPTIDASGYGFQIQTTWRASRRGFRVKELPIHFPDRTLGDSKMGGDIVKEALQLVWKMRLRDR